MKTPSLLLAALIVTTSQLTSCSALRIANAPPAAQTVMSKDLVLTGSNSNKSVFINLHNDCDEKINIQPQLTANLQSKGYTLANTSSKAHYILHINTVKLTPFTTTAMNQVVQLGYGSPISQKRQDNTSVLTSITDIKITEHLRTGRTKIYTTRIGVSANHRQSTFEEAKKPIETKLAETIAEIF